MPENTDGPDQLVALERTLRGQAWGMPSTGILVPNDGTIYAEGTTVPLLAQQMTQTASGLFLPEAATRATYPIDLIAVYVTGEEVFGFKVPIEIVRDRLSRVPRQVGIPFCIKLLRQLDPMGGSGEVDSDLIDEWFRPEVRPRIRALLQLESGRRRLVTEQGVLTLLKRVLEWSPGGSPPHVDGADLVLAYFCLLDGLPGAPDDPESLPSASQQLAVAADVVSSQWFNADRDPVWLLYRHRLRWSEDSEAAVSPRQMFESAVGIPLADVEIVTMALWAIAVSGTPFATAETIAVATALGVDRVQQVLHHLSKSTEDFAQGIGSRHDHQHDAWQFELFERFPLIAVEGGVLTISPSLLLRRTFSWTCIWDVLDQGSGHDQSSRGRFKNLVEDRAERIVREQFSALYPDTPTQRVFGEVEQARAYSVGGATPKRADLLVDVADAWLVVEITSTMPTRDTVIAARDDAYLSDVAKLVNKVRQINSSIGLLRGGESQLTGYPGRPRTYLPLLVCTEGFPVNPMTVSALEERITEEGLLAGADVEPLRLITGDDLLLAEAVIETSGITLVELLRDHARSGLHRVDLRSFIIDARLATRIRPTRLDGTVEAAFGRLLAASAPANARESSQRAPG